MIRDYQKYELNQNEKLIYYAGACGLITLMSVLFFDSFLLGLMICPLAYLAQPWAERYLAERRMRQLRAELVDFLYSLSASVAAGMHMPEALKEAKDTLEITAQSTKAGHLKPILVPELGSMLDAMGAANVSEKQLLFDFADRTGLEDLRSFVEGYYTCRDSGGDLVQAVNRSTQVITDKLLIERDMKTLISQKVFEGRLIAMLPPAIILGLRLLSPDYLEPLYKSGMGRLIMLGALAAMVWAFSYSNQLQKVVFRETVESALPEFMSRLSLLLNSGMVLEAALAKMAEGSDSGNLLLVEFGKIYDEARTENLPVLRKFKEFAVRQGSRELIRFCGIMSSNMDMGTELTAKLEMEADFMWHSAKRQIEEKSKLAETKMTFPMAIMLVVLIAITTAPALMGL